MKKYIYMFIFFRLLGWKIEGAFDEKIKKCVVFVFPHTSWHDFYVAIFTRGILSLNINFVAKKELFRFPFGCYFRWMGGEPVDRKCSLNKVDVIVKIFEEHEEFRLAISPEGTRKKVNELKSGFYYIALKAKVPIITTAFDFKYKTIKIGDPFYPTSNYEKDLQILLQNFEGVYGKYPDQSFG